ncbi:MAG: DUF2786 domain-containing protein [Nitrospirae bacterium]|nr:DUF2786 domain-containing protein [Nitrospirota bacterium]
MEIRQVNPGVFELLERRILHGIALEWESAASALPPAYRGAMRMPVFAIADMRDKWGLWSGSIREITLSRKLVTEHPWDCAREVLHHEMAHQFADEVFRARGEPPHGPSFRKACGILRANPKASGDYPLLDARIAGESGHAEDKMLLRVKKLLALAGSPNRHEAETAMSMAHDLIARYNIDLIERNGERDFLSAFAGRPALRHQRQESHMANLLQDHYFVRIIWVHSYVVEKGGMGTVIEISGTPKNVRLAGYVYDYVKRFIDVEWSAYNKGGTHGERRKTDFAVGVIEGFRNKLRASASKRPADGEQRESAERTLACIKDPKLEDYFHARYPYIRTRRGSSRRVDGRVLQDGRELGGALVIHEGINERGTGGLLLADR